MVNINGKAMSIPGVNHYKKPYVDIGDPLPEVGQRVRNLTDHATIEGEVVELDNEGRRICVKGSASQLMPAEYAKDGYFDRRDIDGWYHWREFEVV